MSKSKISKNQHLYSQKLDALLDETELKLGLRDLGTSKLPNSGDNMSSSSFLPYEIPNKTLDNNGNEDDMDEEISELWELAKLIKKHNDAYRNVAKNLKESQNFNRRLMSKQQNKGVIGAKSTSSTSCSSVDDPDQICQNDTKYNEKVFSQNHTTITRIGDNNSKAELQNVKAMLKMKSVKEVSRQTTKPLTKYLEDSTAEPKFQMLPAAMDKISVKNPYSYDVGEFKSEVTKIRKHNENPIMVEMDNRFLQPQIHSLGIPKGTETYRRKVLQKRADKPIVETSAGTETNDTPPPILSYEDAAKNLLKDLLEHSKTVVMNLLNLYAENNDFKEFEAILNKKPTKQENHIDIGSVLGVPYIRGISDLPQNKRANFLH